MFEKLLLCFDKGDSIEKRFKDINDVNNEKQLHRYINCIELYVFLIITRISINNTRLNLNIESIKLDTWFASKNIARKLNLNAQRDISATPQEYIHLKNILLRIPLWYARKPI